MAAGQFLPDFAFYAVGPADLDAVNVVVRAQAEMHDGLVEGGETAAGFEFAHLVAFAVLAIEDRDAVADAETVGRPVVEFELQRIAVVVAVDENRAGAVQRTADDIEVAVAVQVEQRVTAWLLLVDQSEVRLCRFELPAPGVSEEVVRISAPGSRWNGRF